MHSGSRICGWGQPTPKEAASGLLESHGCPLARLWHPPVLKPATSPTEERMKRRLHRTSGWSGSPGIDQLARVIG